MPVFLRFTAINADIVFGWTSLTPIFFQLDAVNAAIFPTDRC